MFFVCFGKVSICDKTIKINMNRIIYYKIFKKRKCGSLQSWQSGSVHSKECCHSTGLITLCLNNWVSLFLT